MGAKKGLGRGLNDLGLHELLSDFSTVQVETQSEEVGGLSILEVSPESLTPGHYQPRQQIEEGPLSELAESIRSQGLLQPILVRQQDGRYEIIAGERRWRAARLAGLETVPILVRDFNDKETMAVSLIENIQREDLNVIEEGQAFERLMTECQLTHQEVAQLVGKSRAAVTNILRLLKLPTDVQGLLSGGRLNMGHARALLTLEEGQQSAAAQEVVERGLSVRQTEEFVRRLEQMHQMQGKDNPVAAATAFAEIEDHLGGALGTPVQIAQNKKGAGRITLYYKNQHHFERLIDLLKTVS